MSEIELKMEELRKELEKNLESRQKVYKELGASLLSKEGEEENSTMAEYRDEAMEIESRISLTELRMGEIKELAQSLEDLNAAGADLKIRKKTCGENLALLRSTLGEELYKLAKTQEPESPWREAFAPLDKNIAKIRDKETEIFQLENGGKARFVDKVFRRGKGSVLKADKKRMEMGLAKLYKDCFSQAVLLGAGKGDGRDAELLTPFFREDEQWCRLVEEEEKHGKELALARERQKELCGSSKAGRRLEALEKEVSKDRQLLDETLLSWGQAVLDNLSEEQKTGPELSRASGALESLRLEEEDLKRQLEKQETLLDVRRLENDVVFMEESITRLEEEIQSRREEIRSLKKEIGSIGKTIEKKLKAVGEEVPAPKKSGKTD